MMKLSVKRVLFCSLLLGLFIFPIYFSMSMISNHKSEEFTRINSPQISTIYTDPIWIDDLPGSLTNWSWAKDQGYCTGSGTSSNPYVIKNHIFNTTAYFESPLVIVNSRKHFKIENCLFIGQTNYAGIFLRNVTNGKIIGNSIDFPMGALTYLRNSSYNTILNNIASFGEAYGILLEGSPGLTQYNIISNNIVSNNLVYSGICLRSDCMNNVISENIITDNVLGIDLQSGTNNNQIYLNCFNNTSNAVDDGITNNWDKANKGNYWHDYVGIDGDNDGIGDTPYSISGSAGSQDNYPLMKCPESKKGGEIPGYNIGILIGSLLVLIIGTLYLALKKKR